MATAFLGRVLPADRESFWRSLPDHVRQGAFSQDLTAAFMRNPDLMMFDPQQVFGEISSLASLGLSLDPQRGDAWLSRSENPRTQKAEPQLRIGYRGMIKLARQSGEVQAVYAHEICENDDQEIDLGFPKVLHVRPKSIFARGAVLGYFAVVTDFHGGFDFEAMALAGYSSTPFVIAAKAGKPIRRRFAAKRNTKITNAWKTE